MTPAPAPFLSEEDYRRLAEHLAATSWDWGLLELARAAGKDPRTAPVEDAYLAFTKLAAGFQRLPYWAWLAVTAPRSTRPPTAPAAPGALGADAARGTS